MKFIDWPILVLYCIEISHFFLEKPRQKFWPACLMQSKSNLSLLLTHTYISQVVSHWIALKELIVVDSFIFQWL